MVLERKTSENHMLVSTHLWLFIEGVEKHQERVPQKIFVLNHPTLSFQNILQSQQDELNTRERTKGVVHAYSALIQ